MTTPRIEEMIKNWHKQLHTEDSGWDEDHENFENWIRQALTEAHQAGIDEAVEVVNKRKAKNGNGIHDYSKDVEFELNEIVENLKALQDK